MIRCGIFIDGSYMFHQSQQLKVRFDYAKLMSTLMRSLGDRWETESICNISPTYYTALPMTGDREEKHSSFLTALKATGIQIKSVPLLTGPDSSRYSKGEDMLLACDMVRGSIRSHYDIAVLCSGDGDFTPAVQMVVSEGKPITVVAHKSSLSPQLGSAATFTLLLDDMLDEVLLYP